MPSEASPSQLDQWLTDFVHDRVFLDAYPYYAYVLAAIVPVHDPSVPLMGLSLHTAIGHGARYYLHVNVPEVLKQPQFLRGLLLHEVHHLVLGHIADPKFFGLNHKDLLLLAQECSANEYISEPLPEPILWQHFEQFGVRAGQSTLERYEKLCEARAAGREPKAARDTKPVDEHRWTDNSAPHPAGVEETRQVIKRAREQGRDAAEKRRTEKREGARLAGRTPDQLLAQLGGLDGAPERHVPWREALRMFAAEARAPVHTWSRPSRRFPARIGEIPGRAYQHRPSLRPTLLIAIDTSMSVGESELAEIARQLVPMSSHARLLVVECDTEITRTYPFAGRLPEVKGRGGTDLRPVFAPQFLRSYQVDGVVYFTDGQGPTPDDPPRVPVLWVLTRDEEFACRWGRRVTLGLPERPQTPRPRAKR